MNLNCSRRPITDKNFSSHISVSDLIAAEIFPSESNGKATLEKEYFPVKMLKKVLFPFTVNALMDNINLG